LALRAAEKPVILPLGQPEERLRRLAGRLGELGADGEWLAGVLQVYLDPFAGRTFDQAAGLVPHAGAEHWRTAARRGLRDEAVRALAENFPGLPRAACALEVWKLLDRYRASRWRVDAARPTMPEDYLGTPRRSMPPSSPAAAECPGSAGSASCCQPAPQYSLAANSTKPAGMALTVPDTETRNVVELLRGSEVVKAAAVAQAAAQTLARRGLIAQIKTLERDYEKRRPQLEAALAAAMAACKQAEAALLAAQKQANAALGAKSTASYTYSAQRDRLELRLRESAHPALASWVRDMIDELDRTRKRFSFIETHETNPVNRLVRHLVVNNSASVTRRVAAIMHCIDEAERFKLELADQTEIPKLLGELAAALPPVEDPKTNEK
jgi:hypothetical protein